MRYISTRGQCAPVGFKTAVMAGLAPDGGLFLPERIPDARRMLTKWSGLTYQELAFEIMRLFCDVPPGSLRKIVNKSYAVFSRSEVAPLVNMRDYHVLELFHGPTLAFKDFALQFLGNLFEYYLGSSGAPVNLLAATSGDTGSAAIAGVKGRRGMRIFVLYPHGRISPAQELQMTTVPDANVHCLAVRGSFDDCQDIVKNMLSDLEFRTTCHLGAVNSINWARVLAQIVYYVYACFQAQRLTGKTRVQFAVPTGNFGDIFAGYVSALMGLPISRMVLATNRNNILSAFFQKGVYERGRVRQTLSPSMDIQVASNFERYLFYRVGKKPAIVRRLMRKFAEKGRLTLRDMESRSRDRLFVAGSCDNAATLAAIRRCYQENRYVLDPHTAVGVSVARRFLRTNEPMICLATAHPAKFEMAVARALGGKPPRHPAIEALKKLPVRRAVIEADLEQVREFIVSRIHDS